MIRPSTGRLHGGIDISPPVLGGGVSVREHVQTYSQRLCGKKGFCSRREYEVKGEDS